MTQGTRLCASVPLIRLGICGYGYVCICVSEWVCVRLSLSLSVTSGHLRLCIYLNVCVTPVCLAV